MTCPFQMLVSGGHRPSINPSQGNTVYCGVSGETLTTIGKVHPSGKQIQEVNAHSINEGRHIAGQISAATARAIIAGRGKFAIPISFGFRGRAVTSRFW